MPRLIETDSRADVLTDAVNEALALHGPAGLTMRRIARLSGVSTSSILHHLGSKEHLLRVAAHRTGAARYKELRGRVITEGALAFVPYDDLDVVDARSWLAWQEVARCEETIHRQVTRAREDELGLLARTLEYQLTLDDLHVARAVIDGLTASVCLPTQPMPRRRARELLARHLGVPPPPPGERTRLRFREPW